MARSSVAIREARSDDVDVLLELWEELRTLSNRIERVMPATADDSFAARLHAITDDPDSRALVATVDGEVAGMVVLNVTAYAPLFAQRAVHAHYLHVREAYRRHGVGKALLAAAVTFAEEVGAEHVMTSVPPQLRDTQRFYARLGFAPVVVRRSASVSMLRRRLAGASGSSVTDHLVARRRTLRRVRAAVARAVD